MNQTMPTSEVLNRAADLIEERGWATGNCGMKADPSAPMCLEGALAAAEGRAAEPYDGLHYFPDDPHPGDPVYPYTHPGQASHAYKAFAAYVEIAWELWSWNDDQKNAGQVIEALRACAVIEQSRETDAALTELRTRAHSRAF